MKKAIAMIGSVAVTAALLSGCNLFTKEEVKVEAPPAVEKPTPPAAGKVTPPAQGKTAPPVQQDVFAMYDLYQFMSVFNNTGSDIGVSLGTPELFEETDQYVVFRIPVNNGCYMGITVSKETGRYEAVAIGSPGVDQGSYNAFYGAVLVTLFMIDDRLTPDEAAGLLQQLGYGKAANALNEQLRIGNALFTVSYEQKQGSLLFLYEQQ